MFRNSLQLLRKCKTNRNISVFTQKSLCSTTTQLQHQSYEDDGHDEAIKDHESSSHKLSKSVSEVNLRRFKTVFDENEQSFLIDTFNNTSLQSLLGRKRGQSSKVRKIMKFRDEIGGFTEFVDLLKVPGVGLAGMTDICRDLLSVEDVDDGNNVDKPTDVVNEIQPTKQPRPIVTPVLTVEQKEELQSIVTFIVSFEHVTIAKINRELQVEQWRPIPLFDSFVSKLDHCLLFERIHQVLDELPEADIFLREDQHYRFQSLKSVPLLANLKTLEAVFTYALNCKYERNVVHSMKSGYRDKMFKLVVGNESVSGKHVVLDISRKKLTGKNGFFNDVEIPSEFMDDYLKEKSVQQDKLTRTLLQGLTFYKSVIYRY